jgi:hypothetical protein
MLFRMLLRKAVDDMSICLSVSERRTQTSGGRPGRNDVVC